jgi:hypothetical protein
MTLLLLVLAFLALLRLFACKKWVITTLKLLKKPAVLAAHGAKILTLVAAVMYRPHSTLTPLRPVPNGVILFARQPEILNYLEEVSENFNIKPLIQFNTSLEDARWDESRHLWVLDTNQGQYLAKTLICATGPITEPQTPKLGRLGHIYR